MLIYKLLTRGEWASFEAVGSFDGSPFDRSSGFIHCSSRTQVGQTARRVFGAEVEFVVVTLETDALPSMVRWEPAPNGGPFPHVYGSLPRSAVVAVYAVETPDRVDAVLSAAENSELP